MTNAINMLNASGFQYLNWRFESINSDFPEPMLTNLGEKEQSWFWPVFE